MMRHWNTINPGDHDYGFDDAKGPEQFLVRQHDDLGLNPAYLRRNYQIVHHLMTGDEDPSPTENPKLWRRWGINVLTTENGTWNQTPPWKATQTPMVTRTMTRARRTTPKIPRFQRT